MIKQSPLFHLLSPLLLILNLFPLSFCTDFIAPTTSLSGDETLVSAGAVFELGFFSPANNSVHKYIGIWYKRIPVQTVVWVANRENPLVNSTGILKFNEIGDLVIIDQSTNISIWSLSLGNHAKDSVAVLLDSGNLLVKSNGNSIIWQSFDYPTDTLLSGMKLGVNLKTGLNRNITSWASPNDPSIGDYSFKLIPSGSSELFLFHKSKLIYASGPWNGFQFSGVPNLIPNDFLTFSFVSNSEEVYYTYEIKNSSIYTRFSVSPFGLLERFVWIESSKNWNMFWSYPMDQCDNFAQCGPFGVCNIDNSPICDCLPGFEPKFPQEWRLRDGSGGCVRKTDLNCAGDGFLTVSKVKLPESVNATVDTTVSIDECKQSCLRDCACKAYASADISGGGEKGCIIWNEDLMDIRQFDQGGQDLYIRLASSELANMNNDSSDEDSNKEKLLIITIPSVCGVLLLGLVALCIWYGRFKPRGKKTTLPLPNNGLGPQFVRGRSNAGTEQAQENWENFESGGAQEDLELPLFDLDAILDATEDFLGDNKIGQGGFGPVYMGKLENGQDIAVKRLSRRSTQGLDEFKNEVKLVANLQHRNLVRLLGCCIHGEERMLVYEYMHNRSLNTFIFDEEKRALLSWQKRFEIILGIARGLLYLHQDSRFRIIHRDLKASNVLLDRDMNPKISDFGVARIFGGDQTDAHTMKVVGTYGYMSPEYAMDGVFSIKSDVFSFGVLVLEIVSGKKNRGFYQSELDLNLLRFAWRQWKEGNSLGFLDEQISDSCNTNEVLRCIQIGLLCVQEQPRHRPDMSLVTMMLASENAPLPEPAEPIFSMGRCLSATESSRSINNVTLTVIDSR